MTVRDPIKHRDTPARFLKKDWLCLVDSKRSEAKAIEALSHPDPAFLVYTRREGIAGGRSGPKGQAQEEIFALVEKMIASYRELGASGRLIAQGISSLTGLRQSIPSEFWSNLRFDFEANKASNDKFSYSHVTINENDLADSQEDVVARMIAWLTQHRPEKGKALKKMLAAGARAEFGDDYKERAFNEAYSRVYQHRRGRPRGSEKMNK